MTKCKCKNCKQPIPRDFIAYWHGKKVCERCFTKLRYLHNLKSYIIQKEVKVKMDYQKELKRLQESGNYWKPKVGQYKLKALSELEDADPFVKEKSDGTKEEHQQAKVKVLVEGEEKVWTFGKGKTPASTFGQLIELASKHANQLNGVEFSVVVKSDGTKNDYTIVN